MIHGKWTLLPWWHPPYPMAIRTDLLEQIGEKNPADDARPGDRLGRERDAGNLQQTAADLTVSARVGPGCGCRPAR